MWQTEKSMGVFVVLGKWGRYKEILGPAFIPLHYIGNTRTHMEKQHTAKYTHHLDFTTQSYTPNITANRTIPHTTGRNLLYYRITTARLWAFCQLGWTLKTGWKSLKRLSKIGKKWPSETVPHMSMGYFWYYSSTSKSCRYKYTVYNCRPCL